MSQGRLQRERLRSESLVWNNARGTVSACAMVRLRLLGDRNGKAERINTLRLQRGTLA